jgi:hypothetical protein
MSKAKAQRKHARVRAMERYGMEVGPATRRRIIAAIQGGSSFVVRKQSLRVTVHDVDLDETRVRVVYDRQRKELVTFLPRP